MSILDDLVRKLPAEPPRSVKALPGLAYGAHVPKATVATVVAFVGLFALMPILIQQSNPEMRLRREGVVATATVVAIAGDTKCASKGRDIQYRFTAAEGVEARGSTVVCRESPYYEVKPGDTIPVRYMPREPGFNELEAQPSRPHGPPPALFRFFRFSSC